MATREVRVDWSKTLAEEPATGHNRWHPEIPPAVSCDPGDEVVLATRDAFDGQMGPSATLETVAAPNLNVVHPLTGPVYVNGAEPGDLLEVEVLEVEPDRYGYTVQVPGFGFLRDEFPDPFMVRWRNADGWATSDDLPGVRIPGAPFMGTIGLAPDRRLLQATTAREQAALDRAASCSLRTRPTRSRRTPPSPARRCAPSRRGRPPATSTSSSSAPAPGC
jgi:formamidase